MNWPSIPIAERDSSCRIIPSRGPGQPPCRPELHLSCHRSVLEIPIIVAISSLSAGSQIVEDRLRQLLFVIQAIEEPRKLTRLLRVADRIEPRIRPERTHLPGVIVPERTEMELLHPSPFRIHDRKLVQDGGLHFARRHRIEGPARQDLPEQIADPLHAVVLGIYLIQTMVRQAQPFDEKTHVLCSMLQATHHTT